MSNGVLRKAAWASIGAMVTALFIVGLFVISSTNQVVSLIKNNQESQIERGQRLEKNSVALKGIAAQIKDCTDPAGECFKAGQARTGAAVNNINTIVVLAAACADQPGVNTPADIRACIEKNMKGE